MILELIEEEEKKASEDSKLEEAKEMTLDAVKLRFGYINSDLQTMIESANDRTILKAVHKETILGSDIDTIMSLFHD